MTVLSFEQERTILRMAMDEQGIKDPELRAGLAAIAMGESAFKMVPEIGYSHTSNARIRSIFKTKCGGLSDERISQLKASDETFFNYVYAGVLGNGDVDSGDGFRFRGRGFIQLTGRRNYQLYGDRAGVDLVTDPERANIPENAAAVSVAYMDRNYRGGGFEAMKDAVGNNSPDISARKDAYFRQYFASGEFGPLKPGEIPASPPAPMVVPPVPVPVTNIDRVKAIQQILVDAGFYKGGVNGRLDADSYTALAALRTNAIHDLVKAV